MYLNSSLPSLGIVYNHTALLYIYTAVPCAGGVQTGQIDKQSLQDSEMIDRIRLYTEIVSCTEIEPNLM